MRCKSSECSVERKTAGTVHQVVAGCGFVKPTFVVQKRNVEGPSSNRASPRRVLVSGLTRVATVAMARSTVPGARRTLGKPVWGLARFDSQRLMPGILNRIEDQFVEVVSWTLTLKSQRHKVRPFDTSKTDLTGEVSHKASNYPAADPLPFGQLNSLKKRSTIELRC